MNHENVSLQPVQVSDLNLINKLHSKVALHSHSTYIVTCLRDNTLVARHRLCASDSYHSIATLIQTPRLFIADNTALK
jgi:hypothetical protein